ncbi:MAG: alpha/beta fold hydrolase [Marinicellaceae bacterium]
MNAIEWLQAGNMINVNGRNLFVYDSNSTNQDNKHTLLILHGYPTCSYDYYKALPFLTEKFRVIIHDHLGFGYSDKPKDFSYSLLEQAQFAIKLWNKLGIEQAYLLAHDYGTSVATEILALENEGKLTSIKFNSVTLCNGSVHIELAQLRLIQKLLLNKYTGPIIGRLSNKNTLKRNLKNIYFNKEKIDQHEIDSIWQMMVHNDGKKIIHKTTQYIKQRYIYWDRWIGAIKSTDLRLNILWAKNDPIAVLKIAELLYQESKNSYLKTLDNLGHIPMLEDPETWSEAVIKIIHSKQ